MTRRQKKGNYSVEERELILEAATAVYTGLTIKEKQVWLLQRGVHRPGVPGEPVSESAIKYWQSVHKKVTALARANYEDTMQRILSAPPSYRALKSMLNEPSEFTPN